MEILRLGRPRTGLVFLLVLLVSASVGPPNGRAASYVYDGNGRLRAVTSSSGASSQYLYDALGNLVRVTAVPSGQLAVFAFEPPQGPIGTAVTIYGQGFSTTPAGNTVKFNGTLATVSSATANALATVVPSGATTGLVSVTVGGSTANSADAFIVASGDQNPPNILGFTPSFGIAGTQVTVHGGNLAPIAGATTLQLNSRVVPATSISSLTDGLVVFAIPRGIGSGKIAVVTPYGFASTTGDLTVVPSGITTANGVVTTRLIKGGVSGSLNMSAGQTGVFLFDGMPGDWLSLQASTVTATALYQVFDPLGAQIEAGQLALAQPSIHFPRLGVAGTYSVFLVPVTTGPNVTAQLEINIAIAVDSSPTTFTTSALYQSKRLLFPASIGQNIGIGTTALAFPTGTASAISTQVYRPTGYPQGSAVSYPLTAPGADIDLWPLPEVGMYNLVVTPNNAATMQFTETISNDVQSPLSSGVPYALSLTRNGQDGLFTFTGAEGSTVALQVSGITTMPAAQVVNTYVYRPSGDVLKVGSTGSSGLILNLAKLPDPGNATYTVFVDPSYAAMGSMQVKLDPGIQLALDGTPSVAATSTYGESAYFQFSNSVIGQNLGLGLTDLSFPTGSSVAAIATVYDPDGIQVAQATCAPTSGCDLDLTQLAKQGVYSITVAPTNAATMQVTATLSTDASSSLASGIPYTLNLSRPGQDAVLTFTGTSGHQVTLQFASLATNPVSTVVNAYVYLPSGNTWANYGFSNGTNTWTLPTLPNSGTYTIIVDPFHAATATATVTWTTN